MKQKQIHKYKTEEPELIIVSDAQSSSGNYPKKKFRAGPISATIWENSGKNQQGEPNKYNTISLERVYQDKEGNWKSTNSFRLNDLPKAHAVLQRVYNDLVVKEQSLFAPKE